MKIFMKPISVIQVDEEKSVRFFYVTLEGIFRKIKLVEQLGLNFVDSPDFADIISLCFNIPRIK